MGVGSNPSRNDDHRRYGGKKKNKKEKKKKKKKKKKKREKKRGSHVGQCPSKPHFRGTVSRITHTNNGEAGAKNTKHVREFPTIPIYPFFSPFFFVRQSLPPGDTKKKVYLTFYFHPPPLS